MGQDSEHVIKEARRAVADTIGAVPEQIVFTGSGTEANNLAVNTVFANASRAAEGMIFTSPVEHPAVRLPLARIAELGAEVVVLPSNGHGAVDCPALENSLQETLRRGTAKRMLLSVMHVNNELGTIQPIAAIARVKTLFAEKTGADIFLHTDAVQSYGKLPIDVGSRDGDGGFDGVDLLAFSAHKAHGPKGVGALYASNPGRIVPMILGGGQERGTRSGTENVPGIAGFGSAVSGDARASAEHSARLRSRLLRGVKDAIPDVRVNSPEEASVTGEAGKCSPYILNVSFLGTRGEVILHDLERDGVFVSTGSACSNIGKGAKGKNPVLAAAGLTHAEIEGAVRFSFSRYNTEEEIDYAAEHVAAAVKRFRKLGTFR
jgi:cysteine desulfurase